MNSRLLAFIIKELREMLPPTVFFAVGFNLIVLTTNLLLADYLTTFASFMVATATALVVGKAVLVADALPFLRRFDCAPMIQPVLFKTFVYWAVVFLVRFLEKLVEYLVHGGTLSEIPDHVSRTLFLAPLLGYPDLDLRALFGLHLGYRIKCAGWWRRAQEDIFHQAVIEAATPRRRLHCPLAQTTDARRTDWGRSARLTVLERKLHKLVTSLCWTDAAIRPESLSIKWIVGSSPIFRCSSGRQRSGPKQHGKLSRRSSAAVEQGARDALST